MTEIRFLLPSRFVVYAACAVLLMMFGYALPNYAQVTPPVYFHPMAPPAGQPAIDTPGQSSDPESIERERQMRALNADRQKSMVSDTNKLLKLITELNAEVSSANSDTLSLNQIHKLAEIEKLAHNVREKMSTSVRGVPSYQPPSPPSFR